MPGISTSSDIYQNRNQGLTTYRKDAMGPALSEEMAKRTEDRAKAAQVQARQAPASVAPNARAATTQAKAGGVASAGASSQAAGAAPAATVAAPSVQLAKAAPVTPAKVVHELYAPTSRATREHDDRYSMITGGTVDVRA